MPKPLERTEGVVRFENVDFAYPAVARDHRTLTGINLEIRPGKTVGIVGPPGSGKSTIAQLIARYYDITSGRITIDGQDVRDVTLESLRHEVSIVQQQPFLFTASVDHNVAYGDPLGWTQWDRAFGCRCPVAQLHQEAAHRIRHPGG